MKKLRLLISNDDGIASRGIQLLIKGLKRRYHVTAVAPLEEKSTTGHSLTLLAPLRVYETSPRVFGTNGGPADCVHLALNELMPVRPDIVISGINRGANLGQDVFYSGTVSAAREATFWGVPGIAVSLATERDDRIIHYETAVKVVEDILKSINTITLDPEIVININVPNIPYTALKGYQVAPQGFQLYSRKVLQRKDMRGRVYYWIGGTYAGYRKIKDTDCDVVYRQNKVSLTALQKSCMHPGIQAQLKEIFS